MIASCQQYRIHLSALLLFPPTRFSYENSLTVPTPLLGLNFRQQISYIHK